MKTWIQTLLGLNAASVVRTLRFGPADAAARTLRAFMAVGPFEDAGHAAVSQIPVVELAQLLEGPKRNVIIGSIAIEDGAMPFLDVLATIAIATAANPGVVLEIGTFIGRTTSCLAENLPSATIHTVDLPPDFDPGSDAETRLKKDDFHLIASRTVGRCFRGTPLESRIVQHFGDTASWDFGKAAGAELFFIDGSHTYDYVRNDTERCRALCPGKGTFIWHDCDPTHPGVVRFLNEEIKKGHRIFRVAGTSVAFSTSG